MTIFLEIDCERQLMMTMRLVTLWLDQLQAAIAISRSCLNRGTIPTTIPGTIPTIIPGTIPSTTSSTIQVLPYLVPYPVPYLPNITIPVGFMPYMLPYCWGQHVALEVHLEPLALGLPVSRQPYMCGSAVCDNYCQHGLEAWTLVSNCQH